MQTPSSKIATTDEDYVEHQTIKYIMMDSIC